jgi:NAD(P)H-nitrite reductase large subunit
LSDASSLRTDVLDAYRIICLCNKIRKGIITKAIQAGTKDVQAINRRTGTGSGPCGGRRCGPMIREMLGEKVAHCRVCGWAVPMDTAEAECPRCSYTE